MLCRAACDRRGTARVLAVDHRQAAAGRPKCAAIVGGVQLAAEARCPAVVAAERRKQRRGPLDDRDVRSRVRSCGMRQVVAGQALEQRRRHADRERARTARLVADRFERRPGRRSPSRQAMRSRRRSGRRGEQQKSHAAMNRKHAAMVVEADDRVDVASREQQPAQRRAAVIGRAARTAAPGRGGRRRA